MKKSRKRTCAILGLVLLLGLTSCAAPEKTSDTGSDTATAPTTSQSVQLLQEEIIETEGQVRALYSGELSDLVVEQVEAYEGGWLVRSHYDNAADICKLDWVFPSGWRTDLGTFTQSVQYQVRGPGEIVIYTQGDNIVNAHRYMPEVLKCVAREGDEWAFQSSETVYLPLEQEWTFGAGEEKEQLCDARTGIAAVECSFIPPVDSMKNLSTFFAAYTHIPCVKTSYDADSGIFTVRLVNTTLESGEISEEISQEEDWLSMLPQDTYPHSFPAGSLGADSCWITDARIAQDGADAVITITLAPRVVGYRLVEDDLMEDGFPYFCIEFTDYAGWLFPDGANFQG